MNDSVHSQNSPSLNGLPVTASRPTFDGLFYKRLQHIERVLDEDPMELERFKNYFTSLQAMISGKPQSNALLLANQKDLSLDRVGDARGKAKDELNAESSVRMPSHRKGAASNMEQYPENTSGLGSSMKKVVYSIKQQRSAAREATLGSKKQISLKQFNEMKFNASLNEPGMASVPKFPSQYNSPRVHLPHLGDGPSSSHAMMVVENQQVDESLLADFEQDWKIGDNIKRMRQSFNRRLTQTQQ